MSNKPKPASNISRLKADHSVRVPGQRDGKQKRCSLKANVRSSVAKDGTQPDQRRASFEILDSKKLQREGGVEQVLKTIRTSMERLQALGANYREEKRYAVAYCYGLAQHFVRNKRAWAAFCQDKFWKYYKGGPAKADRSEALRFVLLLAGGAKGNAASKNASKLHCAVRPFFDEGVPAQDVPSKVVEGGGFAKLASAHVKKKRDAGRAEPQDDVNADEQAANPSELCKVKLIGRRMLMEPLLQLESGSTIDIRLKPAEGDKGRYAYKVVKLLSGGATGRTKSERRKSTSRAGKITTQRVKHSSRKHRRIPL
ncbi:hypothetical protein [Methylobacterium oryzisoli]|uniref:hypothetical protein n=1 Tax=Methylobacterium oryzisoli TaxID=3385502 RepID=UPI0038918D58